MRHFPPVISRFSFLGMLLALAVTSGADAAEEAEKFLQRLRERGYYDSALEYLDQMKDSPLAPPEFKKDLLYKQGAVLVEFATSTGDRQLREKLFQEAFDKLTDFAQTNAGTMEGAKANMELAGVMAGRARDLVRRADSPSNQAKKEEFLTEARKLFDDAAKVYEATSEYFSSELKDKIKFPASIDERSDPEKYQLRQEFRGQLVQAKLLAATVIYEKAQTFDPTSEQGKALLTDASARFGEIYEKYRAWIAGLYAKLYQGRVRKDLKDYKNAIADFEELVAQPDQDPVMRDVIVKAYVQLAEVLIAQAEAGEGTPTKYDELVNRIGPWLKQARPVEERQSDFIELKYLAAYAMDKRAPTVKESNPALSAPYLRDAERLARDVSRYPGKYQEKAEKLYARLRGVSTDSEPETFKEALEEGQLAVNQMETLKRLPPAETKEEQDQRVQEILALRERSVEMFRLALTLADEEVDIDQINAVRYYLCFLYWDMQRFYDAAVMGKFLALNYPDAGGARNGAKIAMAAFLQSYNEPTNQTKEFEAEQITEVAEFITRRWPGTPDASDAYNMLVSFAVQRNELDEARQYLDQIPKEFAARGKAELKVGQAIWRRYLLDAKELKRLNDEVEEAKNNNQTPDAGTLANIRALESTLDKLKQDAQATLEAGFERMKEEGQVSTTVTAATLSLTQIYVDTSQYDRAVTMLEDPQYGPLTLVKNDHPAVQSDGYADGTYKLALRAYISITPPQQAKADEIMNILEERVAKQGTSEAQEELTKLFISLGYELQQQMERETDPTAVEKLATSFEAFLDRVSQREQGNTWASRSWIATTYYSIGTGFPAGDAKRTSYFKKAITAYQKMLSEVKAGKLKPPKETSVLAVEMRLAECEKGIGKYADALNRFARLLEKSPTMLEAQKAAAYTYQERGAEDPKWYRYAYMGGRPDDQTKKNRIWGWYTLAQRTRKYEQFQDVFFESRYNLAWCRYQFALKQSGADKTKYLNYAENDILSIARLYPQLGGEAWHGKYDELLRRVQKSLNKETVGLKVLEAEATAQAKT